MIWAVDKKVVRHILEADGRLLEIPIRVSFEYALEDGTLVADTLKIETLYNAAFVHKKLPKVDMDALDEAVNETAEREIREHLTMCGYDALAAPANDDDARPDCDGDPAE